MITIITIIFTVILQKLNLKTEFRNSKQYSFEIFFQIVYYLSRKIIFWENIELNKNIRT